MADTRNYRTLNTNEGIQTFDVSLHQDRWYYSVLLPRQVALGDMPQLGQMVFRIKRSLQRAELLQCCPAARREIAGKRLDLSNILAASGQQQCQCSDTGIANQLKVAITLA